MKKTIAALVAAVAMSVCGTAQASSLGDFVDYGKITGNISCPMNNYYGCFFDLKNSFTGNTVRAFVTDNARLRYCEKYGWPSNYFITVAVLGGLMRDGTELVVIWSKHKTDPKTGESADTQPGAINCK